MKPKPKHTHTPERNQMKSFLNYNQVFRVLDAWSTVLNHTWKAKNKDPLAAAKVMVRSGEVDTISPKVLSQHIATIEKTLPGVIRKELIAVKEGGPVTRTVNVLRKSDRVSGRDTLVEVSRKNVGLVSLSSVVWGRHFAVVAFRFNIPEAERRKALSKIPPKAAWLFHGVEEEFAAAVSEARYWLGVKARELDSIADLSWVYKSIAILKKKANNENLELKYSPRNRKVKVVLERIC
jgi:hypothetical protein